MEPTTDTNGDVWEQQQSLRDLQREVARQGNDQEWIRDTLTTMREQVQVIHKAQEDIDKGQWAIRGRLALLIGGLVGFAAIFSFVMGSLYPWFGR